MVRLSANMAPVDWLLHQYQGQLLEQLLEPVTIPVTSRGNAEVFPSRAEKPVTVSHKNRAKIASVNRTQQMFHMVRHIKSFIPQILSIGNK